MVLIAKLRSQLFRTIKVSVGVRMAHENVGTLVPKAEMLSFMIRCMEKVGTKKEHAETLAEVLVEGDYRGHFSHGLNRLEMYVNDVKGKHCNPDGEPVILKESAATAFVDGNNILGPVVGKFCMDLAIEKAKKAGIGWVVARGSNHYGIAGYYSMRASSQGLVGISCTNTSPLVATTRGKMPMLGTNPLSVAAPGKNGDDFVLDMATSGVAVGKIELHNRKGIPIPTGWGIDSKGKVTNDPQEVLDGGALLPLGGAENTSGYKGYGLAMMCEVFCGIMAGGAYGPKVRKWLVTTEPANLGQCFAAIDPNAFAEGFDERMSDLMNLCRNQEPAEDEAEVLVAGDPEKQHIEKCEKEGGIRYHVNQIIFANDLAKKLGVEPPQAIKE